MSDFKKEKIKKYIDLLLKYNMEVNLISRKLNFDNIEKIIDETLMFNKYLKFNNIIDAGSGNGLLGIPLAIVNENKNFTLVETKKKKTVYLNKFIFDLELENVTVFEGGIKNYFNETVGKKKISLIARGFPDNYELIKFIKTGLVREIVFITIEDKIKKTKFAIDNIQKYVYNIPSKDKLKIIKLEKVSRETIKKM